MKRRLPHTDLLSELRSTGPAAVGSTPPEERPSHLSGRLPSALPSWNGIAWAKRRHSTNRKPSQSWLRSATGQSKQSDCLPLKRSSPSTRLGFVDLSSQANRGLILACLASINVVLADVLDPSRKHSSPTWCSAD